MDGKMDNVFLLLKEYLTQKPIRYLFFYWKHKSPTLPRPWDKCIGKQNGHTKELVVCKFLLKAECLCVGCVWVYVSDCM